MRPDLKEKVDAAQAEISRLCQEPYYKWTMTIPARPTDSDLVISEALRELVKEVECLENKLANNTNPDQDRLLAEMTQQSQDLGLYDYYPEDKD
jgi:hypothetical protein